ALLSYFPMPNQTNNPNGNFATAYSTGGDVDQYTERIDYSLAPNRESTDVTRITISCRFLTLRLAKSARTAAPKTPGHIRFPWVIPTRSHPRRFWTCTLATRVTSICVRR